MSEILYGLLFRLFPARFRAAWGEDALELFRDRWRNERGPRARLSLWLDLIADLAAAVPRAYLRDEPLLIPASTAEIEGVPSFHLVEDRPIPSSAFFLGTVLSIVALSGVSLLMRHGGHIPVLRPSAAEEAGGVTLDPWATGHGSGSGAGPELIGKGSGSTAQPGAAAGSPAAALVRGSDALVLFDEAERQRVLSGVIANLEKSDPDAVAARKAALTLRANEALGRYRSIGDPEEFATVVTGQIREATGDLHLEVVYSRRPLPANAVAFSAADEARFRAAQLAANCGFTDVRILPDNVGYLKLDMFAEPEVCGDTGIAAMKTLSSADALIIDLRDNSGGSPDMVMFLAGWLFNKPAFFYNPRENSASRMWTHSPMAGSGLAGKPVYVLTSSRTYSAAEHFTYNLKMLHRATLVGETTGGATDVGVFHRIDDHFGIGIRESRVRNPYPTPDWAVNGVQPDVRVAAKDALATAEKLAAQQVARR